jgi:hypothetical protein
MLLRMGEYECQQPSAPSPTSRRKIEKLLSKLPPFKSEEDLFVCTASIH